MRTVKGEYLAMQAAKVAQDADELRQQQQVTLQLIASICDKAINDIWDGNYTFAVDRLTEIKEAIMEHYD